MATQRHGKVWRVGFLLLPNRTPAWEPPCFGAQLQGISELGYVEGKHLVIEWRCRQQSRARRQGDRVKGRAGHIRANLRRRIGAAAARHSTRRAFLLASLALPMLGWTGAARAQLQARLPRIGYLSFAPITDAPSRERAAFLHGLRELGYIDGKTITIVYQSAEMNVEMLPDAAAELVDRKRQDSAT